MLILLFQQLSTQQVGKVLVEPLKCYVCTRAPKNPMLYQLQRLDLKFWGYQIIGLYPWMECKRALCLMLKAVNGAFSANNSRTLK